MKLPSLPKSLLTVSLFAATMGCADQSPAPITAVVEPQGSQIANNVCPIMGGEATAEVSVEWNGKKIGFCCPPCIEEWEELTDTEKSTKLESAIAKSPTDGATGAPANTVQ